MPVAAVVRVRTAGDKFIVRLKLPPLSTGAVPTLSEKGVQGLQILNCRQCLRIIGLKWSVSRRPPTVVGPPKARHDIGSGHRQHPSSLAESRTVVRMASIYNSRVGWDSSAQVIAILTVEDRPVPVSVDPHLLEFVVQRLSVLGGRK